jgi:hypothetical protein
MSITRTVGTLAHGAVSTAFSAARHPIGTASLAVGMVKGTAEAGVSLVRGVVGSPEVQVPAQRAETTEAATPGTDRGTAENGPVEPEVVPRRVPEIDELPEPVVIEAGDEPGEAFHTEPKAASRASAHGGPAGDREEIEGYAEEVLDVTEPPAVDEGPVWTSETGDPALGSEAGLDQGTAKAVLSEAEMLQKAAEINKE